LVCHPDEASNASGRKDLGQLRAREAGTGSEIAKRSFADLNHFHTTREMTTITFAGD
jgi:hypothetical protein